MKFFLRTLFLASVLTVSANSILADGQIPIGGRAEPVKDTVANTPENKISPASVYIWTLIDLAKYFRI